jgi:hypothetical protein
MCGGLDVTVPLYFFWRKGVIRRLGWSGRSLRTMTAAAILSHATRRVFFVTPHRRYMAYSVHFCEVIGVVDGPGVTPSLGTLEKHKTELLCNGIRV